MQNNISRKMIEVSTIKKFDNLIMSWSCFGDFVLIAHSMHTLIKSGYIKKGVIISHELALKNILSQDENIIVLYPTRNLKDFIALLKMSLAKNIFILHDMPSHNRFTKEIRLLMDLILTLRPKSKSVLLLDQNFKENITTKISKILLSHSVLFDKRVKAHISQYILDLLTSVNIFESKNVQKENANKITNRIICDYNLKLNEKEYDLENIFKNKNSNTLNYDSKNKYIVIHPFASSDAKGQSINWWVDSIRNINISYPNLDVIIIGSKKDYPNAEIIKNEIENQNKVNNKKIHNLCGVTNFRETLYIIKNSALNINVDSGPAHYAACYQRPQILIWGQDNNYAYMPVNNPNATFIIGQNIIKSDDVYKNNVEFKNNPSTESMTQIIKTYLQSN